MKNIWEQNRSVYGAGTSSHARRCESFDITCCAAKRVMRQLGIPRVRRRKVVNKTDAKPADPYSLTKINHPLWGALSNALWVSNITFMSIRRAYVYVTSLIETLFNRIIGWHASTSGNTLFFWMFLNRPGTKVRFITQGGPSPG